MIGLAALLVAVTPPALEAVRVDQLCVTSGAVRAIDAESFQVESESMRAFVASQEQRVSLRFVYLGPTAIESKLASGGSRRQLGLKLAARDGCNVLYVMLRFAKQTELAVSLKSNPGLKQSDQCGNAGYQNVAPKTAEKIGEIRPDVEHVLEARLVGDGLIVELDGKPVWRGEIDVSKLDLSSPVGLRSDNVRFRATLATPVQSVVGEGRGDRGARVARCP